MTYKLLVYTDFGLLAIALRNLLVCYFVYSSFFKVVLLATQFKFIMNSLLINNISSYAVWLCGSVAKSCPALCNPMDCSMSGFPVLHYLLEFSQTHVHWVSDAIQPFHPLSSPFSSFLQSFPASGSFLMNWLGAGEDSRESLGLQGDQTSQS